MGTYWQEWTPSITAVDFKTQTWNWNWLLLYVFITIPFVTDGGSARENDTLGGIDYGTRGMGVCADLGSYRWCQALSRSRWAYATNTSSQNQAAPSEQQKLDVISESTTLESTIATPLKTTTTLTIASPTATIYTATTITLAETAAFTVNTTKRRRIQAEVEDVDEDVGGCSSPINIIKSRTCPASSGSIRALKLVLISLLVFLAKYVYAHNIPGKRNNPTNVYPLWLKMAWLILIFGQVKIVESLGIPFQTSNLSCVTRKTYPKCLKY